MKIYIDGEGISLYTREDKDLRSARVVGLVNLNDTNIFGWSGIKAVVTFENVLYVVDQPEVSYLYTNDDLYITEGNVWFPDLKEKDKFDLHLFEL